MAYVVSRPNGAWEIRESLRTDDGPRSRTLASFRELTPDVVERAQARSAADLDADELREAAHRAGAPVTDAPANAAAAELLRRLSLGDPLRPELRRLLADALGPSGLAERPASKSDQVSHAARAAAGWIGARAEERGRALRDLLLLADAIPRKPEALVDPGYPRILSTPRG